MGSVCEHDRANRRQSDAVDCQTVREIQHTRRRQVVRIGNDGLSMRRYSTILQSSNAGTETDKNRDSASTTRVESAEGDVARNIRRLSDAKSNPAVFRSTGPRKPGRMVDVPRMYSISDARHVKFNNVVTVFQPMDWSPDVYRDARKGPWMIAAADRCRFLRRIKQTELDLGDIFSSDHRERIKCQLTLSALQLN